MAKFKGREKKGKRKAYLKGGRNGGKPGRRKGALYNELMARQENPSQKP